MSGWAGDAPVLYVYRVTLEFIVLCDHQYASWPKGKGALRDQLSRAADSILLNIAEGCGQRVAGNSGRNFFRIALGSASECAAILDRLQLLNMSGLPEERRRLLRIAAMLRGMSR